MAWQESWLRVGRALDLMDDSDETNDLCARVAKMLLSKDCPSLALFLQQTSPGKHVYPQMPSIKDAMKTPGSERFLCLDDCSPRWHATELQDLKSGVAPLRRVYIYLLLHLAAQKSGRAIVVGLRRKDKPRGDAKPWGRMLANANIGRGGNRVVVLEYRVWENAWHNADTAPAPPPRRTSARKRTPTQGDVALMQELAQAPQLGTVATKRPKWKMALAPQKRSKPPADGTYEIRKLLNKRLGRRGRIEYLVAWEGYDSSEDTWEPASELPDHMVRDYGDDDASDSSDTEEEEPAKPARAHKPGVDSKGTEILVGDLCRVRHAMPRTNLFSDAQQPHALTYTAYITQVLPSGTFMVEQRFENAHGQHRVPCQCQVRADDLTFVRRPTTSDEYEQIDGAGVAKEASDALQRARKNAASALDELRAKQDNAVESQIAAHEIQVKKLREQHGQEAADLHDAHQHALNELKHAQMMEQVPLLQAMLQAQGELPTPERPCYKETEAPTLQVGDIVESEGDLCHVVDTFTSDVPALGDGFSVELVVLVAPDNERHCVYASKVRKIGAEHRV